MLQKLCFRPKWQKMLVLGALSSAISFSIYACLIHALLPTGNALPVRLEYAVIWSVGFMSSYLGFMLSWINYQAIRDYERIGGNFGDRVKERREKLQMHLRDMSAKVNIRSSIYSRMERNIQPAPNDPNVLELFRVALQLEKKSAEWKTIAFLAQQSQSLPRRVLSEKELLEKLPVFIRKDSGEPFTDAELEGIITMVRNEHEYDPEAEPSVHEL